IAWLETRGRKSMASDSRKQGEVSRRDFIKCTVAGAAVAASGGLVGSNTDSGAVASGGGKPVAKPVFLVRPQCNGSRDLALYNGYFIDQRGYVTNQMTIKDGWIVDTAQARDISPCTLWIDLKGRTVIPGLVDSSAHFTRTGCNPGFETRWTESAFSI